MPLDPLTKTPYDPLINPPANVGPKEITGKRTKPFVIDSGPVRRPRNPALALVKNTSASVLRRFYKPGGLLYREP